jgi:hypothetical protein
MNFAFPPNRNKLCCIASADMKQSRVHATLGSPQE